MHLFNFLLQEEEIVKPKQPKKRKKLIGSDSDWPSDKLSSNDMDQMDQVVIPTYSFRPATRVYSYAECW